MGLPLLLAVDEDRDDLAAIESQLVRRYARDYRVECLADPAQALSLLKALAQGGEEVTLVLARNRPGRTTGFQLLDHARLLHPHAKRALLVPADVWLDEATAEAIRVSLALGRIDYYVSSPLASVDEEFHEAVSSFLLEWTRDRGLAPQTIHIVGETWSGRAYELRKTLEQCAVPHTFCLADSDQGRILLANAGTDPKFPLMVLPNGQVLNNPSNAELARVAGAPAGLAEQVFDAIIVGAGPAGLSAAVYAASEGLKILVIDEGGIGGQARSSSLIRNYLGFAKGVSGSRLAEQAYQQATAFGANFLFMHRVIAIARSGDRLSVSIADGPQVGAGAVILATGATYRRLEVPALEALNGAGVFYGSPLSEASALSGKDAYITGGGNSAGQAAVHLARYARRVTLVVRAASLVSGMSDYLVRAVEAAPNVEVRTGTEVIGGGGDGLLQQLVLRERATNQEETVPSDALFVMIGARPHSDWLPADIARDAHGFVLTGPDIPDDCEWPLERLPFALETSIPGVLAVGDVRNGSVKRVASAAGEGAIAVTFLHSIVNEQAQHRVSN
ncbi:MAG: FAD-dependent oxidoreductase [Thiotrichales bacterium]